MKRLNHVSKKDSIEAWQDNFNKAVDFSHTLMGNGGDVTQLINGGDIVSSIIITYDDVKDQHLSIGDEISLRNGNVVNQLNGLNDSFDRMLGDINYLNSEVNTNINDSLMFIKSFIGDTKELDGDVIDYVNEKIQQLNNLQLLHTKPSLKSSYELSLNSIIHQIGSNNLNELITTNKSNLINAINDLLEDITNVDEVFESFKNEIGFILNTLGSATEIIADIRNSIGDINAMKHVTYPNVVSGITNFIDIIGNLNNLTTVANDSLIVAINETNTWKKTLQNTYTLKRVSIGEENFNDELNVVGISKSHNMIGRIEGDIDGNIIGNIEGNTIGSSISWKDDINLNLIGDIYGETKFGAYDDDLRDIDVSSVIEDITVESKTERKVWRFYPGGFNTQRSSYIENGELEVKRQYELSGHWDNVKKTFIDSEYEPHVTTWTYEGKEYENHHYHVKEVIRDIPVGRKWINTSGFVDNEVWVDKSYWLTENVWINTSKWERKTIFVDNSYTYQKESYNITERTPTRKYKEIKTTSKSLGTFSKGTHLHDDKYLKLSDQSTTTYVYVNNTNYQNESTAWNEMASRLTSYDDMTSGSTIVTEYSNGKKWVWIKYKSGSGKNKWMSLYK